MSVQAPNGFNQAQYQQQIDTMSTTVISTLNNIFNNEWKENIAREARKEPLPDGTESVVLHVPVDGKEVRLVTRNKHLCKKYVINDVDQRIKKLDTSKMNIYNLTFEQAESKMKDPRHYALTVAILLCDSINEKEKKLNDSLFFKSAVYGVVVKSLKSL
ncbi:MAG: hypothetical protein JSR46_11340 [Verrucomicrobia bacterium]|nr:hypothetical protein [Verrucomicrobiota bacterium]